MRRSRYGYNGYRGRRTAHELLKLIALVLAVLISAFLGQAKRIDELEQRLKALEEAQKPENE